jgi:hypothetical protein
MSTLMKQCKKCGETTKHYYVSFVKPNLKCYDGWKCWPCKKKRLLERQATQDYRDTLSCRKCGESRRGKEDGHFDYLDGKDEVYTCRKCFTCDVCGTNLSDSIARVDYGDNFQLHAHTECRPQEEPFVSGTGNWKKRGMVLFQ